MRNVAEYHVLLYELDSNKDLNKLLRAYNFIKENPHPQLYKRICLHIFNHTLDNNVFIDGLEKNDINEL